MTILRDEQPRMHLHVVQGVQAKVHWERTELPGVNGAGFAAHVDFPEYGDPIPLMVTDFELGQLAGALWEPAHDLRAVQLSEITHHLVRALTEVQELELGDDVEKPLAHAIMQLAEMS